MEDMFRDATSPVFSTGNGKSTSIGSRVQHVLHDASDRAARMARTAGSAVSNKAMTFGAMAKAHPFRVAAVGLAGVAIGALVAWRMRRR